MKKHLKYLCLIAAAAFCIVSQTGCAGKEPVFGSDFLLNTSCTIQIYEADLSRGQQEKLIQEVFALCRSYEKQMSRTVAEGDVGKINSAAGGPVQVEADTAEVIRAGLRYGHVSQGLFDITVGQVAAMWNFTGENPAVPDSGALAEAVKHVNYKNVTVEDTADGKGAVVQVADSQAQLDLGGIAKGFIADKAAASLRSKGVTSGILNFGGNIICIGEKAEGIPFSIGVEKPFSSEGGAEKEILGTIGVADQAVVTSGTYERKFYQDGVLYYHILDPKTGYPRDTDLDGVSIIGPSSTDCDGLSTTCLMLGLEAGKALIDSLPDVEAVFVAKDGRIVTTDGLTLTPAQ